MKNKILYLITGLHTGGAEMVLKNIVNSLDKNKFDVLVVSLVENGLIAKELKQKGIKVISLGWRCKLNIFPILRLVNIIKKEKPNIIHAHLFHANIVARLLKLVIRKVKIISTIHSVNFGGKVREFIMRITGCLSDKTIVVSKKIYEEMLAKKIISKKRSQVIYNGIDVNYFKESSDSKEFDAQAPKLLSVGRLSEAKGYKYLVRAVAILKKKYPKIILTILGEGKGRTEIEKEIKKNNLEKNIQLLGNKKNVKEYFGKNNIFVSSSLWEGLPIAICEAMAGGILVVATRVGGTPEVIDDGINGLLVKPKDEKELSTKIEILMKITNEEKEVIVKNAQEKIKNNFSNEIMINNYEKIYNNLCHSGAIAIESLET